MKKILYMIFMIIIFTSSYTFDIKTLSDEKIYSKEVNYNKYPNASVAILLNYSKVKINDDDTYDINNRVVKKILNYKGKKDNSEFKIYYDKRFEKVVINRAVTIKKDGEIVEIDKEGINELDSSFDIGNMYYAIHKTIVVAFTSVDEGDIVDIDYTIKNTKKDKFTDKVIFAGYESVYNLIYQLELSKGMSLNINTDHFDDSVKYSSSISDNKITHTWSSENLPQLLPETSMESPEYFMPMLSISRYNNWTEFKNLIYKKMYDQIKVSEYIKELSKNICKDATDDKDKIIKIKNYLAKNLENKSVNRILDYDVRNPDNILKSSYANSLERAVVFISMLKNININAYPIIIGYDKLYWKKRKDFLQIEDFTYVVTNIHLGMEEFFVDPTSEFSELGSINIINEIGLLINKGPKNIFVEVESNKVNKNRTDVNFTIKIDKNGDAIISKEKIFSGYSATLLKQQYKYMTPIKRKQNYEQIIGSISLNAEPISEEIEINYEYPTSIKFTYKHKEFAIKEDNFLYFDLPYSISPFKLRSETEIRTYPFVSFDENENIKKIVIELPKEFKPVIYPKDEKLKSDTFIIERSFSLKKGKIDIMDNIKYIPNIIKVNEYKNFYNDIIELSHKRYDKILLKLEK